MIESFQFLSPNNGEGKSNMTKFEITKRNAFCLDWKADGSVHSEKLQWRKQIVIMKIQLSKV